MKSRLLRLPLLLFLRPFPAVCVLLPGAAALCVPPRAGAVIPVTDYAHIAASQAQHALRYANMVAQYANQVERLKNQVETMRRLGDAGAVKSLPGMDAVNTLRRAIDETHVPLEELLGGARGTEALSYRGPGGVFEAPGERFETHSGESYAREEDAWRGHAVLERALTRAREEVEAARENQRTLSLEIERTQEAVKGAATEAETRKRQAELSSLTAQQAAVDARRERALAQLEIAKTEADNQRLKEERAARERAAAEAAQSAGAAGGFLKGAAAGPDPARLAQLLEEAVR